MGLFGSKPQNPLTPEEANRVRIVGKVVELKRVI